MRNRRLSLLALAAVAALALTACGGGGDNGGGDNGGGDNGGGDDATNSTITVTAPAGAVDSGFATTSVTAPADTPFTIHFVNDDDGIPHNVQIFEGSEATGTPVWAPKGDALITGPDETDYDVPAVTAGTYTFNCLAHPTTMIGTLAVQ